jgi:hypothetical protein
MEDRLTPNIPPRPGLVAASSRERLGQVGSLRVRFAFDRKLWIEHRIEVLAQSIVRPFLRRQWEPKIGTKWQRA